MFFEIRASRGKIYMSTYMTYEHSFLKSRSCETFCLHIRKSQHMNGIASTYTGSEVTNQ